MWTVGSAGATLSFWVVSTTGEAWTDSVSNNRSRSRRTRNIGTLAGVEVSKIREYTTEPALCAPVLFQVRQATHRCLRERDFAMQQVPLTIKQKLSPHPWGAGSA